MSVLFGANFCASSDQMDSYSIQIDLLHGSQLLSVQEQLKEQGFSWEIKENDSILLTFPLLSKEDFMLIKDYMSALKENCQFLVDYLEKQKGSYVKK